MIKVKDIKSGDIFRGMTRVTKLVSGKNEKSVVKAAQALCVWTINPDGTKTFPRITSVKHYSHPQRILDSSVAGGIRIDPPGWYARISGFWE